MIKVKGVRSSRISPDCYAIARIGAAIENINVTKWIEQAIWEKAFKAGLATSDRKFLFGKSEDA
ncbi:MAG TPA: hypothetical protein DCY88_07940 [Cyanobacteria bacterium UBA11372]|nr:hypothetical protein [Cyanobacteria bacterium UBA11372]